MEHDHRASTGTHADHGDALGASGAVGKRTLTGRLPVRRKAAPDAAPATAAAPAPAPAAAPADDPFGLHLGGGAPLPADVRGRMEGAFGTDLGAVRLHQGDAADQACDQLQARAFAAGNDIAFRSGQFRPGTPDGDHLIAHELAHTVQQSGAVATSSEVSQPGDPGEVAADRAADAVLAGETDVAARLSLASSGVQRSIMRESVTTYGGTFKTVTYEARKKEIRDQGYWGSQPDKDWYLTRNPNTFVAQPACEIELHFEAGPLVDCAKVGLVQTVKPTREGAVDASRPETEARATKTGEGDRETGRYLDREAGKLNPNYDVENPAQPIANPTTGDLGSGEHLTEGGQKGDWGTFTGARSTHKPAWLKDYPSRERMATNKGNLQGQRIEMRFETTALCEAGALDGTYLGAVEWGFTIDAAGTLTKLPFVEISKAAPSTAFMQAAGRWNGQELSNDGSLDSDDKSKTIPLPLTTTETSSQDLGNKTVAELYVLFEGLAGRNSSDEKTKRLAIRGELLAKLNALDAGALLTELKRVTASHGTFNTVWAEVKLVFEAAIQAKATKTPSTTDTWRMDHDEARPHNGHGGDLESLVRWGIGSGELAVAADWVYVYLANVNLFRADIAATVGNTHEFKMPKVT